MKFRVKKKKNNKKKKKKKYRAKTMSQKVGLKTNIFFTHIFLTNIKLLLRTSFRGGKGYWFKPNSKLYSLMILLICNWCDH